MSPRSFSIWYPDGIGTHRYWRELKSDEGIASRFASYDGAVGAIGHYDLSSRAIVVEVGGPEYRDLMSGKAPSHLRL